MAAGHYENFPVASRLVPAALRPAVMAIYRFARAADDFADEGDAPPAVRLAQLDAFDAHLREIAAGRTPEVPPFPELATAIRAHRLPLHLFHALLSAFRQDVTVGRYATYADVLDYSRRSADPVGRLLLALYGVHGPVDEQHSDAICTGLQLTNFWQDVAVDWRKDRVYLPQEDLDRFGVPLAQIADSRADERWRALMAFETARARALLHSGRPLARRLPWRLGLELSAVIEGGLRILARIDAAGGDVFAKRPVLRKRDWCAVAYRAVVQ
ncbi:MAG: squalene synthase HpnC [Burkholderiales bacterium]|nr:squalene synthase HpnC [Burkholderiales bacterium]